MRAPSTPSSNSPPWLPLIVPSPVESGASAGSALKRNIKDILAGTCGGIAVTLVGHPFDTIKVLLQTQSIKNPTYSGVVDCASKTVKSDGFLGLYKGVQSPLVGQMAFRATLFLSYGVTKDLLGANPAQPLSYAQAGALAWCLASLAEGPIDFYKSQMQKQLILHKQDPAYVPENPSLRACVARSFHLNGVRGPYQGLSATLMRNLPAAALYFGTFENTKLYFARQSGTAPTFSETLTSAGFAGFMYWVMFYPTDVIKSAMMTDHMIKADRKFPTISSTISTLYAEGGLRRFYTGLSPCLIRAVPANAVMLTTVDLAGRKLSVLMGL